MYQNSDTSPKSVLVTDGVRYMPSQSSAGSVLSGPRSTHAVRLRCDGLTWSRRRDRHVQVPLIPELRTERLVLIHVHVIESLGRLVPLILDQRIIRSAEIRKAGAASWFHALRLRLRDARAREAEHAARSWPRIAADEDRAGAVAGVKRHQGHVLLQETIERLAHVGDVPSEMPERGLRLRGRRRGDPVEQHQHVVRRAQGRLPGKRRLRCRWEGLRVELDRGFRVDGVEMEVVKAGSCQWRSSSSSGPGPKTQDPGPRNQFSSLSAHRIPPVM